jgi:hypothetical protein
MVAAFDQELEALSVTVEVTLPELVKSIETTTPPKCPASCELLNACEIEATDSPPLLVFPAVTKAIAT